MEGYQWKSDDKKYVDFNAVGPRYFETVGIPIVLGRDFRDQDNPPFSRDPPQSFIPGVRRPKPPGPREAIINESMAKQFFPAATRLACTSAWTRSMKPSALTRSWAW